MKSTRGTTRFLFLLLLIVVVASVTAAGPAAARTRHWFIGLDGVRSYIGEDENPSLLVVDEVAGGGALQVGYAFNSSLMLRLYTAGADHETNNPDVEVRLAGALFELLYLFRDGQEWRPYLFGGLGGFSLESQLNRLLYETEGPGISFGGGVHFFAVEGFSLHASLRFEGINWDTLKIEDNLNPGTVTIETPVEASGGASKLTLGATFWF